jgi:hypothetical protein
MSSTSPRLAKTPLDRFASPIQVLMVGPWQANEFGITLSEVAAAKNWQAVDTISSACAALDDSAAPPELLLLAQPLPGYYQQKEINDLQRRAPLARIVVVAGTWCEGELRTGKPPWGVLRLYWHEFAPWWTAAQLRLAEGQCPSWSLPLDSPGAGRFQPETTRGEAVLHRSIAISAADYSTYSTFAAALRDYGLSAVQVRKDEAMELPQRLCGGIWVGGQLDGQEVRQLKEFCQKIRDHRGQVVAILDFPRAEHVQQARDAGARAVFGKPYVLYEVVEAVHAGGRVLSL